jgi:Methyltransferase domain
VLNTLKDRFQDLSRLLGMAPAPTQPPVWRGDAIHDAWFDAHFNYATDVVADWIEPERLRSGHLLDFGCGDGITGLGLILRHGAQNVTGIDISATHKGLGALAKREIGLDAVPRALRFQRIKAGQTFTLKTPCDAVMTWSTFEHIELPYLSGVLRNLHAVMADDAVFFLQINPLYYSPVGSHLSRFKLPDWAHLLWSPQEVEDAVMKFHGEIPADETEENFHKRDFKDYKAFVLSEYNTLNRLTTSQLIGYLNDNGFEVVREVYGQVAQEPPPELLEKYTRHDLVTDEVRLLLRKRKNA